MVVGFVCTKVTTQVTTINLGLPAPFSEGYIIRLINSYGDKEYNLAYENGNWNLKVSGSQITVGIWLRFPIVYIAK